MTDYGQPLSFGTVLTPVSARPGSVIDLARLTEAVGLDMVSVPDHPYQPRFLEAWTVLSVVAAHTTRVRLLPNVANLGLRPPALLARSAASLDLLSGGRAELGLGAGGYWDAIAAEGGHPPLARRGGRGHPRSDLRDQGTVDARARRPRTRSGSGSARWARRCCG